ncbi:type IV toxin-antitoxin system AbiEi family antitoxin [Caballeronia sp. LZ065]|uniref:hypothetical protein n=1 Tax=Caballeronia sp. LZ065 TaxID=3038571 RepID=UPI002858CF14|nr:hypothetical protein [Caballeronia sp. LZ065]MDR5781971.1 type IV toxin-antitoxin system AbiEi family antitoxin [Caballeronia sp. LZ065]
MKVPFPTQEFDPSLLRAEEALREMLAHVPALRIESINDVSALDDWKPNLVVRITVKDQTHLLICVLKPSGQPRYARGALLELRRHVARHPPGATPVFIAPYISPAVRQLCSEEHASYLDLQGNTRIAFDGVFIERIVADKPQAEQRELKSLFRPKSAQVLRAMLREPGRAWRVSELADMSGVSLGHVSNVRNGLLDREWARTSDDGLVLCAPAALLDAWRDSYTAPAGEQLRFYTPLHGSALEDAARDALRAPDASGHAAFASFSAAQWLAPYGRTGTHYFYADETGLRTLQTALKLAPAAAGENVSILVPKDPALLADTIEPALGAVCTSPVQTWLDLSIAGERGVEAADHLRQEKLPWSR